MKITEKIITDDQRISKTKGVKRTITQNDNLFNINPSNSGILVSLARILAKDQICGCLYIDEKKNIFNRWLIFSKDPVYEMLKTVEVWGNIKNIKSFWFWILWASFTSIAFFIINFSISLVIQLLITEPAKNGEDVLFITCSS
jgi:hypothetical protein